MSGRRRVAGAVACKLWRVHSKIATARMGLAVPPRILSGKPMKRNRPRPTSLSRLARHSMCDPPFATCEMGLEVGFAFGGWAHRLHTKHADAPVGQPMHAFYREAGEIVEVARLT